MIKFRAKLTSCLKVSSSFILSVSSTLFPEVGCTDENVLVEVDVFVLTCNYIKLISFQCFKKNEEFKVINFNKIYVENSKFKYKQNKSFFMLTHLHHTPRAHKPIQAHVHAKKKHL